MQKLTDVPGIKGVLGKRGGPVLNPELASSVKALQTSVSLPSFRTVLSCYRRKLSLQVSKSFQSFPYNIPCLQAMFVPGSNAFKSSDMLMRDATNATNMFQIASKDMKNWHSTYLQTIKKVHELMLPEHICPNISVPLSNLRDLQMQIKKVSFQIYDSISYHLYMILPLTDARMSQRKV